MLNAKDLYEIAKKAEEDKECQEDDTAYALAEQIVAFCTEKAEMGLYMTAINTDDLETTPQIIRKVKENLMEEGFKVTNETFDKFWVSWT